MTIELAKAAAAAQVKSSAKFEALIGLGTSSLIFNSIIQSVVLGASVPTSHIILVFGMIATFFINRGVNILSHLSEMESRNRAAKIESEIQLKRLDLEIEKLKLQKLREPVPVPVIDPPPSV